MVGPFGNPLEIRNYGHILGITGGVEIAKLFPESRSQEMLEKLLYQHWEPEIILYWRKKL